MEEFLNEIAVPVLMVLGLTWGASRLWTAFQPKPTEQAEEEEEEIDEPLPIQADTVAKQISTNRNTFVYNRIRGDLERIHHLQEELDKIEELITQADSYYFMNTAKLEKNLTITAPKYAGSDETISYNLDLYNNPHGREIALNLLHSERDRISSSLLAEISKISEYAVTETVTKTYDLDNLRGVVDSVLKGAGG